jgi:hypothetical protein
MPTRKRKHPRNLTKIVRKFKLKHSQINRNPEKNPVKVTHPQLNQITVIECFDVEKTAEISERRQFYYKCLENIPLFDYFSFSADDTRTNVGISNHCPDPHYYTNVDTIRKYLEGLRESRIIYIIGHGSLTPGIEVMRYDNSSVCSAITLKQQNPLGNSVICYEAQRNANPNFFLELSKLNLRVPQLFILEMCYSGKFVPPNFTFPPSNLQLVFAVDKQKQDLNGSTIKDYAFNQRSDEYYNSYIRPNGTKDPRYMRIDSNVILKRSSPRDQDNMDTSDSGAFDFEYSDSDSVKYSDSDKMSQGGKKKSKCRRKRTRRWN